MTKKNKKNAKKVPAAAQQCQIIEKENQPSLHIILEQEVDPDVLSQWPKLRNQVPAIFLHQPVDFEKHLKKILSMDIQIVEYSITKEYIKITCASFDDHKLLTQYFEKKHLPYHTYGHPSKRKLKVVIKGLPYDIDLNHLKKELCSLAIPVIRIHKMNIKVFGKCPPIFVLAVVPYDDQGKNILKLKMVSGKSVKLEPPETKTIQCYRCQKWGHAQRYCHGQIKCVKCGDNHSYKKCERDPTKEDPKCANCGGDHTANYKKCGFCPDSIEFKVKLRLKQAQKKMLSNRLDTDQSL